MNKLLLMFAVIGAMERVAPVNSVPANHDTLVLKAAAQYTLHGLNQNIAIFELSHMVRYITSYVLKIYL